MKSKKRERDRELEKPRGASQFIDLKQERWTFTTAAIDLEESVPKEGCLETQALCHNLWKRFTEMSKSLGPSIRKKGRILTKAKLSIRDMI